MVVELLRHRVGFQMAVGDGREIDVPQGHGRIVNVLGAKIEARLKKPLAFRHPTILSSASSPQHRPSRQRI
jgi:hypothetical protein